MSKLILIDQIHIEFLISKSESARRIDTAVRAVRKRRLISELRKAIETVISRTGQFKGVKVRLTR